MSDELTGYTKPPLYRFDEDGFVLPPFDERKFPFVVAVCGGACYTATDGPFVRRKFRTLLTEKVRTHNISIHLAPSPGAARILFDALDCSREYNAQVIHRGRELWGRACDFRAAYALMDCAHALIAFEPFDLITHYAHRLAQLVPDHDGRDGGGVKIAVVRRPTDRPSSRASGALAHDHGRSH